jgi:aryl-alcohol dehydrogenase-like predicted oxidoreductase
LNSLRRGLVFASFQNADAAATSIVEQVEAMGELVKQGKVRHIGLSNETPYGLLKFLEAAKGGLPAVVSVQNAYNLLERNDFETSMLEACHYTGTGLIAHSPLAGGALTGKYMLDAEKRSTASEEARLKKYVGYTGRYLLPSVQAAVAAYAELAAKYGLSPEQLALAFCYSRPFVASTLIGATNVEQLRENIMALNCPLTSEMEGEIFELYCNEHREPTKGVHIL